MYAKSPADHWYSQTNKGEYLPIDVVINIFPRLVDLTVDDVCQSWW